mgnify:CR=1
MFQSVRKSQSVIILNFNQTISREKAREKAVALCSTVAASTKLKTKVALMIVAFGE